MSGSIPFCNIQLLRRPALEEALTRPRLADAKQLLLVTTPPKSTSNLGRVVKGMALGEDPLPQFASTPQRVLTIILELEDRDPVSISRTEGSVWYFDKSGDITEGLREALFLIMG